MRQSWRREQTLAATLLEECTKMSYALQQGVLKRQMKRCASFAGKPQR
jgi:hypothetical protein